MKRLSITIGLVLAAILIVAGTGMGKKPPTHLDTSKNEAGCGGCHAGTGVSGTPLLMRTREALCFSCHGSIKKGKKGESKTDVESVFAKNSKHPIFETAQYHMEGEDLPERNPSAPRHVSCPDCHRAHAIEEKMPWAGSKGYSSGKIRMRYAVDEYELCYLCHSDSANLPPGHTNKSEEFDTMNASFHPVEARGAGRFVPSLKRHLSTASTITCSDCHGNNDPYGPNGPHGSDYAPLLKAQYRTMDSQESSIAYELCYMCHDRRSILDDESFKAHKLHIVYNDTSCFTCHETHGSRTTPSLIGFNETVVKDSPTSGGPEYIPIPSAPRCYLQCHGVDHSMQGIGLGSCQPVMTPMPGYPMGILNSPCKKWPW